MEQFRQLKRFGRGRGCVFSEADRPQPAGLHLPKRFRPAPGFELALNRALAITPQHPAVLAQLGYALCYAGDWRRGLPLIEEAIPLTYEAPTWYYAAYAFVALRQHHYAAARDWALKIEGQQWFMAPLLVAVSAASAGSSDIAAREVQRLLELKPDFAATGRELLTRWNMDPDLLATLIAGLKLAGLELQ